MQLMCLYRPQQEERAAGFEVWRVPESLLGVRSGSVEAPTPCQAARHTTATTAVRRCLCAYFFHELLVTSFLGAVHSRSSHVPADKFIQNPLGYARCIYFQHPCPAISGGGMRNPEYNHPLPRSVPLGNRRTQIVSAATASPILGSTPPFLQDESLTWRQGSQKIVNPNQMNASFSRGLVHNTSEQVREHCNQNCHR